MIEEVKIYRETGLWCVETISQYGSQKAYFTSQAHAEWEFENLMGACRYGNEVQ